MQEQEQRGCRKTLAILVLIGLMLLVLMILAEKALVELSLFLLEAPLHLQCI
ncbi:MAG: hypothetical protein WBA22_18545 [Candidatus Methanofastidiosia archaeon]